MGKYSITFSESQCEKFGNESPSSLSSSSRSPPSPLKKFSGKEESTGSAENNYKFAEGPSRTRICEEGGRWKDTSEKNSRRRTRRRRRRSRGAPWSLRVPKFGANLITVVSLAIMLSGLTTIIASPTPSLDNKPNQNYVQEDYEDFSIEDSDLQSVDNQIGSSAAALDSKELDKIRLTIMQDLGLSRIPDPSKANVSQTEYENAHREYLKRVELSKGQDQRTRRRLHVFYPADPVYGYNSSRVKASSRNEKTPPSHPHSHSIYFPVEIPSENHAVDHATLRILIGLNGDLAASDNAEEDIIEVSIYQPTTSSSRRLIARQRVSIFPSSPRWAEFDSTEAVSSWYHDGEENLGFQIEINHHGAKVKLESPGPSALNVFTISDSSPGARNRRATPDQLMSLHRGRRTECRGQNKKCCRHQMMVIFKDLKGFEFIIQPKDFDAGYCKGRCPPRYNPAHHHALLQSLIWKEDRKKAPRPCCAPSKLTELEILYFDENDATKLKVSNWKNMKVLECACS